MDGMRGLFEGFGECARQVAGCVFLLCCGGPIMLIIGCVMLAAAAADGRGKNLATYNAAIVSWSAAGGGGAQFANAFPAGSSQSVSIQYPWAATASFPLTQRTTVVPLADSGGDAKTTYAPINWFTTAGITMPSPWLSTTGSFQLTLNGTSLPSMSVDAWKCSNSKAKPKCSSNSQASCPTYYYRNMQYLTGVDLKVTLPATCAPGACAPTGFTNDACTFSYSNSMATSITLNEYNADAGRCAAMGLASPQPGVAPTVSLRSAVDPFVVADRLTSCSLNFGPTAKQYRASGVGLLVAGALLIALMVSLCCVLVRRKKQNDGMMMQTPGMAGYPQPVAVMMQPGMQQQQGGMMMQQPMQGGYAPQQGYPQQQMQMAQQQQPQYGGYGPPPGAYTQPPQYGQPQYGQPGYGQPQYGQQQQQQYDNNKY